MSTITSYQLQNMAGSFFPSELDLGNSVLPNKIAELSTEKQKNIIEFIDLVKDREDYFEIKKCLGKIDLNFFLKYSHVFKKVLSDSETCDNLPEFLVNSYQIWQHCRSIPYRVIRDDMLKTSTEKDIDQSITNMEIVKKDLESENSGFLKAAINYFEEKESLKKTGYYIEIYDCELASLPTILLNHNARAFSYLNQHKKRRQRNEVYKINGSKPAIYTQCLKKKAMSVQNNQK